MHRRPAGFFVIELLIAAAVLAIIATILIPLFFDSIDKAKQKRTMTDLNLVGKGIMSWLTDEVSAAAAGAATRTIDIGVYGDAIPTSSIEQLLVPDYVPIIPPRDAWGGEIEYRLNTSEPNSQRLVAIRSAGKDRVFSGDRYEFGAFAVEGYDEDILWTDGIFSRWPQRVKKN